MPLDFKTVLYPNVWLHIWLHITRGNILPIVEQFWDKPLNYLWVTLELSYETNPV